MVACEQANPSAVVSAPSAIDVSPVIIAPREGNASSYNTPSILIFGKRDAGRSTFATASLVKLWHVLDGIFM